MKALTCTRWSEYNFMYFQVRADQAFTSNPQAWLTYSWEGEDSEGKIIRGETRRAMRLEEVNGTTASFSILQDEVFRMNEKDLSLDGTFTMVLEDAEELKVPIPGNPYEKKEFEPYRENMTRFVLRDYGLGSFQNQSRRSLTWVETMPDLTDFTTVRWTFNYDLPGILELRETNEEDWEELMTNEGVSGTLFLVTKPNGSKVFRAAFINQHRTDIREWSLEEMYSLAKNNLDLASNIIARPIAVNRMPTPARIVPINTQVEYWTKDMTSEHFQAEIDDILESIPQVDPIVMATKVVTDYEPYYQNPVAEHKAFAHAGDIVVTNNVRFV